MKPKVKRQVVLGYLETHLGKKAGRKVFKEILKKQKRNRKQGKTNKPVKDK